MIKVRPEYSRMEPFHPVHISRGGKQDQGKAQHQDSILFNLHLKSSPSDAGTTTSILVKKHEVPALEQPLLALSDPLSQLPTAGVLAQCPPAGNIFL